MIASSTMRILLDHYGEKDFFLIDSYYKGTGVKVYMIEFDDESRENVYIHYSQETGYKVIKETW